MQEFNFVFQQFERLDDLTLMQIQLLDEAYKALDTAYAPYSKYRVGAALLLENNNIVIGSNQENASYPAGICAERVALSTAATHYPNITVKAIAIVHRNEQKLENDTSMISPCGICRQSILEQQNKQQQIIQIIMSSPEHKGVIVDDVSFLLPFAFSNMHF